MKKRIAGLLLFGLLLFDFLPVQAHSANLEIENGWLKFNDNVIWGLGQYSEIWKVDRRGNITKKAPGVVGPNRTEDIDKLTDSMLRYGYPVLEHQYGLWYDRRRNQHDTVCRKNNSVKGPFFELPWERSDQGMACDGLPLYDLETFNNWYFSRLKAFANMSDTKGTLLIHNYYLQHNFLERQTHYVDFPWRPGNSIQDTGMPDNRPAANAFYDVNHKLRRELHRLYIRQVLDTIGDNQNVIHFTSAEYTGNLEFVQFWMDTIVEWENEMPGRDVKIGISAPKEVLDGILNDPVREPLVSAIDLRYFWYEREGELAAIKGGREIPGGRYFNGDQLSEESSPALLYKQTALYRKKFPNKVIFHSVGYDLEYLIAFLMAGGSVNIAKIHYKNKSSPKNYVEPETTVKFQFLYDYVRTVLGSKLTKMKPNEGVVSGDGNAYAMTGEGTILVYSPEGEDFALNLNRLADTYHGAWFNPANGNTQKIADKIQGNTVVSIKPPTKSGWLLLLEAD